MHKIPNRYYPDAETTTVRFRPTFEPNPIFITWENGTRVKVVPSAAHSQLKGVGEFTCIIDEPLEPMPKMPFKLRAPKFLFLPLDVAAMLAKQ